tara:strand:- start:65 stop:1180 length:1116 start_codon:yes stop_codon:yes gene_type:complete
MNIKRLIVYLILSVVIIFNVSCSSNTTLDIESEENIESEYVVTTIAGSTEGDLDGTGIDAQFDYPHEVAVDNDGSIIVVDTFNHRIRKIDSNGVVTTIAGSPEAFISGSTAGYADGTGINTQFNSPRGVAIDNDGAIIVADTINQRIRKIDSNGVVTTIAGSTEGYTDGTGTNAQFDRPTGVAIDNDGSIIVVDTDNHRIRKIDSNGNVTTIAGSTAGYADGTGTNSQFYEPSGVAIDNDGSIIVADTENHRIRKIDSNGVVTTIAGSFSGYKDGTGTNAYFFEPEGVAIDNDGSIIVADTWNHRIRKIDSNGVVTTIAGSTSVGSDSEGYADGTGTNAQFYSPMGVAIDNDGAIIVADTYNQRIRKIEIK